MTLDINSSPKPKGRTENRIQDKPLAPTTAEGGKKQESATAQQKSVSVSISAEAKNLDSIEKQVKSSSSFDKEKVATIKQALQDGNYTINFEKVAEKLLNHESLLNQH
ncbi:MAG: flagellar biosynthesis anti-sigma factor FlgM [Gammaproteobacteria bacterium]|nr:flagellar biosynthesis anti-sigma factor FlgM [Gammaproteobacteria bacterium]